ncbi:hypothetical protein [Pseudoalteromonas shioyasakiensis]|uniref:hypothetical protein n=1 Tax=Pseudoalteromonas shioyasakiensis TaxID=1190813 RepID=UPI00142F2FFD|nr:hypothetical protein [Pseudoalteromonas shioyasakiensis]
MMFSLFATLAIAADEPQDLADQYYVGDGVTPKQEIKYQYVCDSNDLTPKPADNVYQACQGYWLTKAQEYFAARTDVCSPPQFEWDAAEPNKLHQNFGQEKWNGDCEYTVSNQKFYGTQVGSIPENSCPPDDYPNHTHLLRIGFNPNLQIWEIQPEQPEYCYMSAEPDQVDKSCKGGVGEQAAFNSITVNNEDYPDGGHPNCLSRHGKICEVTGGPWLDTVVGETTTTWSVGSGTFTGNECDPTGKHVVDDSNNGEDKFCSAQSSGGVYQVSCPESGISINWNQVTGLEQTVSEHDTRITAIEASFITETELNNLVSSGQLKGEKGDKGDKGEQGIQGIQGAAGARGADGADGLQGEQGIQGEKGEQGEQGEKGEKGEKGDKGEQGVQGIAGQSGADGRDGINGINGIDGKDGRDGIDGVDGEDGENCSVVATPDGVQIACADSLAQVENGDSCTTQQLANGDAQVTCEDGTTSTINGVDEDAIIAALDTQLSEMKKQTGELEKQSKALESLGKYDGDKPKIDYETKPDTWTEIAEFDWENQNFGTVLEEHTDQMKALPIFTAIDNFFVTSFGGACPTWSTTVDVMGATFRIDIDQFCSPAVQNILPAIRAILLLVAGFFAWRIAIE